MEGDDEDEKELVSVAQEGVIRVCERMWEVDAHSRRVDDSEKGVSEGYCGLLADTTQIGAVVGRGGKNVVRMRRESGAQIRILPAPPCAAKDDELIQVLSIDRVFLLCSYFRVVISRFIIIIVWVETSVCFVDSENEGKRKEMLLNL